MKFSSAPSRRVQRCHIFPIWKIVNKYAVDYRPSLLGLTSRINLKDPSSCISMDYWGLVISPSKTFVGFFLKPTVTKNLPSQQTYRHNKIKNLN